MNKLTRSNVLLDVSLIILIIFIIIIGYHGLFWGQTFFVDQDCLTVFQYAVKNSMGNGWRPDLGLGISAFLGDPGATHVWSVFSLLHNYIHSNVALYNTSIILLLILASVSNYYLLKKLIPNASAVAALLSLLVVFGPCQHEFYFQRHWITLSIGTPLIIIILYNHFTQPNLFNYFKLSLLLWFVWFLGSYQPFLETIVVGFLFMVFYIKYNTISWKYLLNYSTLFIVPVVMTFLLGMWVFYSIIIEFINVKYIRDPLYYSWDLISDDIRHYSIIFNYLFGFLHSGWWPYSISTAVNSMITTISWVNVTVTFPIYFLICLNRPSNNFWEFSLKGFIIIFYINLFLHFISPAYGRLWVTIFAGYGLGKFEPAYHCFQVALIGILITGFCGSRESWPKIPSSLVIKITAISLLIFYSLLLIISIVIYSGKTETLINIGLKVVNLLLPPSSHLPIDILKKMLYVLIINMKEAMNSVTIALYFSSVMLILPFISNKIGEWFFKLPSYALAVLLLLNNIFLSWTVYPLNDKHIIWQDQSLPNINLYDRFYQFTAQVRAREFLKNYANEKNAENKLIRAVPIYLHYPVGVTSAPGLNLSGQKLFTQMEVEDYLFKAFASALNGDRRGFMRRLGSGPLVFSKYLNIAAVKYYYCFSPLESEHSGKKYQLIYENGGLFIYRNKEAWPYYYLTDPLYLFNEEVKGEDTHEYKFALSENGDFLPPLQRNSFIKMKVFRYGKMVFDYSGNQKELIVVADAWHPFWKGYVDQHEVAVLKVNKIFKGLQLPPGKHLVQLVFNTDPYMKGVYISLGAWILFIGLWFWLGLRHRSQKSRRPTLA